MPGWRWLKVEGRREDQLNSCIGQIDENGWRTMQTSYLAFGEALQSRVLYDGAKARFASIAKNTPAAGQSTITLVSADLATDTLNGALLFVARPNEAVDRHMEAVVVDTTSTTIVIADALGAVADALYSGGEKLSDFVVFAFNDSKQANAPTYQTQGTWTSAPSFASSQTTFTDAEADDNGGGFASWMIGAILVPDVNIGAPLIITGTTATTLTVAGDARGVAANGTQYIVYAAPFTDAQYGVWQTDAHKTGSRHLWAGYRYQPPQLGFRVDPPGTPTLGTYGAATGTNKLGQYYCWNRTYDINTGRWTTPDPAATPWWNSASYGIPVSLTDPNGLGLFGTTLFADKICDRYGQLRSDVSGSDVCEVDKKYGNAFLWPDCQGMGSSEIYHCLGSEDRRALEAARAHIRKNGINCDDYEVKLLGFGVDRPCPFRGRDLLGGSPEPPTDATGGLSSPFGGARGGNPFSHSRIDPDPSIREWLRELEARKNPIYDTPWKHVYPFDGPWPSDPPRPWRPGDGFGRGWGFEPGSGFPGWGLRFWWDTPIPGVTIKLGPYGTPGWGPVVPNDTFKGIPLRIYWPGGDGTLDELLGRRTHPGGIGLGVGVRILFD